MQILKQTAPFFYKFMTRKDKFLYYIKNRKFQYKKYIMNKSLAYLKNYIIYKSHLGGYVYKSNEFACPRIRVELLKIRDLLNSNVLSNSVIKRLKGIIVKFVKFSVPQLYTYYKNLNKYKMNFHKSYLNNSYNTSYKLYITAIKKWFINFNRFINCFSNSDILYLRQQSTIRSNFINIKNYVYSKNFKYLLRSYKKVILVKENYYSLLNKLRISKNFINLKNLISKLVLKLNKIGDIFNNSTNFINGFDVEF